MLKTIVFPFLLLVVPSTHAQKHPLKDFCRLFGHQSTVVDRKQYYDGGLVNWEPVSATSTNYTSTWLRVADLDQDNLGFPEHTLLAKNESTPSVHGGVLWADEANKLIYQYGGEYGNGKPEDFKLWYYDIIYNTWNISQADTRDYKRAAWGAGAVAQDKGLGFYYGGWLTNSSVPGYESRTPLNKMLVYDMENHKFTNDTSPLDEVPRAEGVLLYIPAGDSGMLVYFGGLEYPYGNATEKGANMSDIHVFDISGNRWYGQQATGEIPEPRRRFCAGVSWIEDRSSYNIYLFGGASIEDGYGYGDVYVLSLPSFRWIKFWPESTTITYPHHSLSCNVIDNAQMIVTGGHFTNFSGCDVPTIYGQHGLGLGVKYREPDSPWHAYYPNLTTYEVPPEIVKVIGGGPNGGATLLTPSNGWGTRDLQTQFQRVYEPSKRDPTRPIPGTGSPLPTLPASGGSNKGAVIGGAVGGTVGGLLVASVAGVFIFLRRRRTKNNDISKEMPEHQTGENSKATAFIGSPPATQTENIFSRSAPQHEDPMRHIGPLFASEMPVETETFEMPGMDVSKQHATVPKDAAIIDSRNIQNPTNQTSVLAVASPTTVVEPYFVLNPPPTKSKPEA